MKTASLTFVCLIHITYTIYSHLYFKDSGNSDATKENDNLNIDSCISKGIISETDVDINSSKDMSAFENILQEVPI